MAPTRTCVGCRRQADPAHLLRVAMAPEGELLVGRGHRGRGAWLCRSSPSCLERAVRRGALSRALRMSVPADVVDTLRTLFVRGVIGGDAAQVCEDGGSGRYTGTPL